MNAATRRLVLIAAVVTGCIAAAAIVDILVSGCACWQLGAVHLLQARRIGRPLVMVLGSVLALVLVLRPAWLRPLRRLSPPAVILLAVLTLAAVSGLAGRPGLHGDGLEYVVQTQSLVFGHELQISPGARRDYWNRTNPYGVTLGETKAPDGELAEANQAGGGFGGLYPDRFGGYRYYHFWAYSLFVAPLYLLAHLLDPAGGLEYRAFQVANVLLLVGFLALLWLERRKYPVLALVALALVTPLVPYCDWQHPELFCLFFTFFALWAAERKGSCTCLAPLSLGLAAAQNLPILLFFPFLGVLQMPTIRALPASRRARLLLCYTGGGLLALSSLLYFKHYFGTGSVIAAVGGASLDYASLARTGDLFFSPLSGAVFFYSAGVLPLLAVVSRRNLQPIAVAVLCVAAAAWLSTATGNFNSGQIGAMRYAVWLLAPLWYCAARWLPPAVRCDGPGLRVALSLLACLGFAWYFGTYRLLRKDAGRFEATARARPEVARLFRWTHYRDDVETLVENILARELPAPSDFDGVYLWDLGRREYLWVFSARALAHPGRISWRPGDREPPRIVASPEQPLRIAMDGERATFGYSAGLRTRRHPVLGEYVLAWSYGRIEALCADTAVSVRSDQALAVNGPECRAEE
jgi:hypothetical protein